MPVYISKYILLSLPSNSIKEFNPLVADGAEDFKHATHLTASVIDKLEHLPLTIATVYRYQQSHSSVNQLSSSLSYTLNLNSTTSPSLMT